ncbi:MAG: YihY/virulence factor BrkB family protein [Ferruginibacter sp.]|nr:YihY/virulence factor BrkB family protein [Rhodoferax sp.]
MRLNKIKMTPYWNLIKNVAVAWVDDYAPSMGAALAYYTMFSLAPLLLIAISVAGLVFGEEAARGEIFGQLRNFMGDQGASTVQGLLVSVHKPSEGMAATALGVFLLFIGAASVFGELQNALNRIWRAPVANTSSWVSIVRERLLSFGMILAMGFLLIVSLVVSAALSTTERWLQPIFGDWLVVAAVINAVGSFLLVALMFALIYKIMPRARVEWKDVWIGSIVTALLFTAGKSLIGLYVGRSGVASAFGAAGSLVVILVWVYYSAQIFLIGAEFTWCYATAFGSRKGLEASSDSMPKIPPRHPQLST